MRAVFEWVAMLGLLLTLPMTAQAGWVSQWTNVATKPNGEKMDPQSSTMDIAADRVRLQQPESTMVIDYNTGKFTVINPTRQVFWSGSVDDYVRATIKSRGDAMTEKLDKFGKGQQLASTPAIRTVDPAKLPPLSILKTDVTDTIAGYDTVKYDVNVDGTLFQELWVAPALNVSSDLNVDKFLAVQRKISGGMAGKAADQYAALYYSDEYKKLIEKAFVLKMITHHIAGQFERTATSIREASVAADAFAVPEGYRKVRLSDVLAAPEKRG